MCCFSTYTAGSTPRTRAGPNDVVRQVAENTCMSTPPYVFPTPLLHSYRSPPPTYYTTTSAPPHAPTYCTTTLAYISCGMEPHGTSCVIAVKRRTTQSGAQTRPQPRTPRRRSAGAVRLRLSTAAAGPRRRRTRTLIAIAGGNGHCYIRAGCGGVLPRTHWAGI